MEYIKVMQYHIQQIDIQLYFKEIYENAALIFAIYVLPTINTSKIVSTYNWHRLQ